MSNAIEVRGLTKSFGRTVAVDDLTFTVPSGRVTGFMGPNGAGKSTTMRMILALDRPTAGQVLINGGRYRDLRHPMRSVGALLDAGWVHPRRSARRHLQWLTKTADLPRSRVDEVLDAVGLTAVADRPAGGFSLGMRQRLGIASALLGDPAVLLFDEPVNGLDPEGIAWFRRLVHRLADEGRAVLVSSHLLAEMAHTAHETIIIGRGRLITQASVAQLLATASGPTVCVRSPEADRLAGLLAGSDGCTVELLDIITGRLTVKGLSMERIGEIAAANAVVLHELAAREGSLEQAFMSLTENAADYVSTAPGSGTTVPRTSV
ncbi:MAG: ABC transporter ATP-binding protein [Pseudonocardia sp.]